ncbi:helix-turn-helix transcriptional regulator [Kitasatospora sp. NPDC005751]|uniref:helix-turn-helix domain-containing protein n=1 Tax=Kitasatospora sp. NPDC005751 TaxID=3157064 RepID=UPI003400BC6D
MADFDGEALRLARTSPGPPSTRRKRRSPMTAEELASAVGATKAQILAYELGQRVPEPQRVRALASALGVHPVTLSHKKVDFGSLAELRRAYGYRSSDICAALNISAKAYRRFETSGIPPVRRPELPHEIAAFLRIPVSHVQIVVAKTPAARDQIDVVTTALARLREEFVQAEGSWIGPPAGHRDVLLLANLLNRSAGSISRLVTCVLEEERTQLLRIARYELSARFETDEGERLRAESTLDFAQRRYGRAIKVLPAKVVRFVREWLHSDAWSALAQLVDADEPVPISKLGIMKESLDRVPWPMIIRFGRSDGEEVVAITGEGANHCIQFMSWYRALYPSVRVSERAVMARARRTAFRLPLNQSESPGPAH